MTLQVCMQIDGLNTHTHTQTHMYIEMLRVVLAIDEGKCVGVNEYNFVCSLGSMIIFSFSCISIGEMPG